MIVGGKTLWCNAKAALIKLAAPAAALVCPICDLTVPKAICCFFGLFAPKTLVIEVNSVGSPTIVPVPCASIKPTLAGEIPASS